ncbi:MAG: hypothetical protein HFH65_07760 [Lachnospiraceae bacterium]|nr:hypothetical protein [Lachnospiraceae bacterium]MCI9370196.1 hypothetical protein [Lachnospiraceae bacterium]
MGITFKVTDNKFQDFSSMVINADNTEQVNDMKTTDDIKVLNEIKDELNQIKNELNSEGHLYQAIEHLQIAVETNEKPKIKDTLVEYAREFSMPFFANVASASLLEFLSRFK